MTPEHDPTLRLAPEDDRIVSDWTTEPAALHFHDSGFDDYGTEVITLDAAYEHRGDVKALDWEETHRKWIDDAWHLDFVALDTAVEHFLDRGYSVTIAASELSIFLSDYDAPFLEVHVPAGSPPDIGEARPDRDSQSDLSDF